MPNNAGELSLDIDTAALALLRRHPGVTVVPMISNYYQEKWNGGNVRRMIATEATRQRFITNVLQGHPALRLRGRQHRLQKPEP